MAKQAALPLANGKWQIKIKMRKTEWDFHPKANATLIYFAEANGKWSLFSLCHLI
jgi:hypothetical protein